MKKPPSTKPKPFVFVLMPFDAQFDDIYKFGIQGAATDVGAYAERVDEQLFTEGILDRIFTQISKADVVVADMTGLNPVLRSSNTELQPEASCRPTHRTLTLFPCVMFTCTRYPRSMCYTKLFPLTMLVCALLIVALLWDLPPREFSLPISERIP